MKTIIKKKDNFTTVHNKLIIDTSISYKAKGILIYMLSRPDGWKYNAKDIANNSKESLDSIYSGLKELIATGYISRKRHSDGSLSYYVFEDKEQNGIIDCYETNVRENPNRENPNRENPNRENPNRDNPDYIKERDTLKKEYNKRKNNNKDIYSRIINYLNIKTGKKYRESTKVTQRLINGRMREGFTEEDFKTVIDKKTMEWTGTEWERYLTPDTLFSPSKFEKYLNQEEVKNGGNKRFERNYNKHTEKTDRTHDGKNWN